MPRVLGISETLVDYNPSSTSTDGGWAWVVVFACFVITFVSDGIQQTVGIICVPLQEYFGASETVTSFISSFFFGLIYCIAPVATLVVEKTGYRFTTIIGSLIGALGFLISVWAPNIYFLYFSTGAMAGIGLGAMLLVAVVIVQEYFSKHLSMAIALGKCGGGVSSLVLPPLLGYISSNTQGKMKYQSCFYLCSGMILLCIPCALVFKSKKPRPAVVSPIDSLALSAKGPSSDKKAQVPEDQETSSTSIGTSSITARTKSIPEIMRLDYYRAIFTSVVFQVIAVSNMICSSAYDGMLVYLPPYCKDILKFGPEDLESQAIIGVLGVSSLVSQIFIGWFSDRYEKHRFWYYVAANAVLGVAIFLIPIVHSIWWVYGMCCLLGFSGGICYTLDVVTLIDFLGHKWLNHSYGFFLLYQGIGAIIGPPLLGVFYEILPAYTFYFTGLLTILASIMLLPLYEITAWEKRRGHPIQVDKEVQTDQK